MSFIKGARPGLGKRCRQSLREFILQSFLPSASPLPGKPVMFLSSQHYCKSFTELTLPTQHTAAAPSCWPARDPGREPPPPASMWVRPAGRSLVLPSPLLCRLSEFKPEVFLCETRSGAAGPAIELWYESQRPRMLAEVHWLLRSVYGQPGRCFAPGYF